MDTRTSRKEARQERVTAYAKEREEELKRIDEDLQTDNKLKPDVIAALEKYKEQFKPDDKFHQLALHMFTIQLRESQAIRHKLAFLEKRVVGQWEIIKMIGEAFEEIQDNIEDMDRKIPTNELQSIREKLSEYDPLFQKVKERVNEKKEEIRQAKELQEILDSRLKNGGSAYA